VREEMKEDGENDRAEEGREGEGQCCGLVESKNP